jgi:hypothetical protein
VSSVDTSHFRADICSDPATCAWYHFDPYNFPSSRVLQLAPNLPVAMGGLPVLPAGRMRGERARARDWFVGNPRAEVSTVVYVLQPRVSAKVLPTVHARPELHSMLMPPPQVTKLDHVWHCASLLLHKCHSYVTAFLSLCWSWISALSSRTFLLCRGQATRTPRILVSSVCPCL